MHRSPWPKRLALGLGAVLALALVGQRWFTRELEVPSVALAPGPVSPVPVPAVLHVPGTGAPVAPSLPPAIAPSAAMAPLGCASASACPDFS
jgi:hypothetical protein